ncbi:MAG: hypothetical protein GOVbin707_24 [Prokaryotic dsDNA virus sp.]|nr:MAG: hypothetical protein GOVbin707_24 [Prokaryotic dsDNA virus sp.]|tara:strand:- start:10069 stop:10446 length:378 start_codon:yes stop_codon:yes gene_type:complete
MTMLPMSLPMNMGGMGVGMGLLNNAPNNMIPMMSPILAMKNKYVQQAMSPAMMLAQRPEFLQYLSPLAMLMKQSGNDVNPFSFLSPLTHLMGRNPTDNDLNFMQGVLPNLAGGGVTGGLLGQFFK